MGVMGLSLVVHVILGLGVLEEGETPRPLFKYRSGKRWVGKKMRD